jgi:hypothetical protein
MKNVHLLKTEKLSRLCKITYWDDEVEFFIAPNYDAFTYQKDKKVIIQPINIYITSDEEIKEVDWWLNRDDGKIYHNIFWQLANNAPSCKKIILTTDIDLIADDVQAIDDDFLKWFVKNPSCEEVEIKISGGRYSFDMGGNIWIPINYKIIIPKGINEQYGMKTSKNTYTGTGLNVPHGFASGPVDNGNKLNIDEVKQNQLHPILIVRNDDKEEFIHLKNGMYRSKWGIMNNSVSETPLKVFDKSLFTFYYE